jgi:hypothetical protein
MRMLDNGFVGSIGGAFRDASLRPTENPGGFDPSLWTLRNRGETSMKRGLYWAATAAVVLMIQGGVARAQYSYPGGYGGFGWGGWGGGGATVGGDQARGLGVFAAGAGQYNEQTAVARSINAQTAMQWNEYIYQSNMEAGRIMRQNDLIKRKEDLKNYNSILSRIRDNPTESDIMRGDALNVALDEVTAPKVYLKALQGAKLAVPGKAIREIPFNYAAEALTLSVDDITKSGPPELLKGPEFNEDREALRAVGKKIREEAGDQQPIEPAQVKEAQGLIKKLIKSIKDNPSRYPKNSPKVVDAENWLKGLYGLISMLETPAIDVLLSGVEKRPDTTLGDLLSFMHAFNLRFGPAKTPQQRQIYTELFPVLDKVRDEVVAAGIPPSGPVARNAPAQFFQHMDLRDIDAKPKTPPPPAPRSQP